MKNACDLVEDNWMVLNNMISDLNRRGIKIPYTALQCMRTAKALIGHCRSCIDDECRACFFAEVRIELTKVEDTLMMKAFNNLGEEYTQKWLDKISSASKVAVTA